MPENSGSLRERENVMKITITDIASLAGVSITTVSRVINNKSKGVSETTRQKVWRVIEENNYQPNAIARGLVTKSSKIIGLLLPDITNPYYPQFSKGIEDTATRHNYNVILCEGGNDPSKEKVHLDFMTEHYVSGVVYSNADVISDETLEQMKKKEMKTVFVDSKIIDDQAINIHVDNHKAIEEVMHYLYSRGHRKIAFLGGIKDSYSTATRFEGYLKALDDLFIPFDQRLVVYGDFVLEKARVAVRQLLDKQVPFSAIICCNDMMAVGAYEAFNERQIKIPEQISVVGFDDIYMSKHLTPRLTTIKQPAYEMGQKSAETVIAMIEGRLEGIKKNIILDTELMIRDSVADIQ